MNAMADRMPPSRRTSASQITSGQFYHLKPSLESTTQCRFPDRIHGIISPKPSTPQTGQTPKLIDAPNAHEMDKEMQVDQELLTIALNEEARPHNIYKNKIDEWNIQKNINELQNKKN